MEKVGFDYYQNVFLGSEIRSKKVFEKLELYALSYIDKITFGRINFMTESIKCAVCNVCEALFKKSERCGIKQETNDGYSITYADKADNEFSDIYMAAAVFLPTELLYKGL